RRFVAAGGKIYAGTDSSAATTPGLSLHHEMELLVDAGIPPMQAISAGTRYGAELLGLDAQIGTVEAGKLADLVVLGGDPLQDIRKTKSLEKVIKNGEILDIGYHSSHQIPFSRPGPESKHLYNPAPKLLDIDPPVAAQGDNVNLRLLGRGFVANSVVRFNGNPLDTRWVSSSELRAVLPVTYTSKAGTFLITVQTPKPGGGVSEPIEYIIGFP
ncbi:MAG: amidohydrolase family protein, partial [Acidobacteria bacterium]|nr:amidohydrolase family protein [Acidobacteriota bacterium]